jgi:hypothetical protein
VPNAEASIEYLAPYVFKVAISDHRILTVEDGQVCFSYRKPGSTRPRTLTLDALEFIRRFLQHVLPTGFMKVRDSRLPLTHRQGIAGGGQSEGRAGPRLHRDGAGSRAAALAATRLPGLRWAIALP